MALGAALNIPAAMHIIVHMFPEPAAQSKAIAAFAGAAAVGNGQWTDHSSVHGGAKPSSKLVIGLIIGAALVSYSSWP